MITIIVSILLLLLMGASLRQIFHSLEIEHKIFSSQLFIAVMLLYTIVMIGFGLIYTVLILEGVDVYRTGIPYRRVSWIEEFIRSIYFSGVTLFTVGYGDMLPVGAGKWLAILEAMIGYTLPAALAAKVWQSNKKRD
ncbi:two pore domain potassium channel family protein [Halobacillus kuroshimensis]|uniref:Two pore domain potassium channel family protein n=1 Tax=Halobacillus kuroshimensis TaxID=302481 RepID=A0ABS3DXM1_9BACI|nr:MULTISPECIES: potassium channel family protein [Halobacillus]MBN8236089.1 two pore domain potassium channel family protein [Halobacillus kuroshimensis]